VNGASLAKSIDNLYRRAVEHPGDIDEPVLIEWVESVAESAYAERETAKVIRRTVRTARKLARYWAKGSPGNLPDWRNGIDEALGGQGWVAQLDALMLGLEHRPDPALFDLVKERHRMVHFTEWMEGVSYGEWLRSR